MPDWKIEIRERLAGLKLEPAREEEIAEELAQHLDDRYRELLSAGATEEEARRALHRELASFDSLAQGLRAVERQASREVATLGAGDRRNVIADAWQDLRYAARMMRKNRGFTFVAVLTLALGIGPVTAIFTLANAVLFKPLPYKEPERLVRVYKNLNASASVPDFVDWRDHNQVLERMGTFSIYAVFNLMGEGEPEAIQGSVVAADTLAVLGVEPLLGRWFLPEEGKPGASPVLVMSHALWQQRFGADPNILDRKLTFDSRSYTVVGVMPPGFEFPILPSGTQIWTTAAFDENDPSTPRSNNFLNVVARLKAGVTIEQARTNLRSILEPHYKDGIEVGLVPLHEQVVEDARTPLLVLFASIAFVLLIACANVANLLLARAASRQKEVAVRTALGASQFRLFRQLLTESILFSAIGGALGLLLAIFSLDLLIGLSPIVIPRLAEVGIDWRVIGFLFLIVSLVGAIFGTLSAFRLSEPDLREALKEGTGRATSGLSRQRLRSGLVVAEIALSLVLLLGAALMLRSVVKLQAVDPGFKAEGVLAINVTLPQSRYPETGQRATFIQKAIEGLEAMPQARSVASTAFIPLTGPSSSRRFAIQGLPSAEPDHQPSAAYIQVSSEFFNTLGIPIVAGRSFALRDDFEASNAAIVNQAFAQKFFPYEEVVGKSIRFYSARDPQPPWLEIVGVVGDIRQMGLGAEAQPEIYVPHSQSVPRFMTFFVRTEREPLSLTSAAKSAIQAVDKDQPVAWITTLNEVMSGSIADRRGLMFLLGVFAAIALLLSAIGIYGVISHSVSQRTHEIGIRMALGAQAADVLKLIFRQAATLMVAGVALGLAGALLLTRVISNMLFKVSATDPLTFVIVPLMLAAVALLACYIPARRASRVDPMVALKYE